MIEALKEYQEDKSTFPWYVRQKSHYYALDQAKKWKTKNQMTQSETEEKDQIEQLTTGETLEDTYEKLQTRHNIVEGIKTLHPKEQKIIIDYYYKNKTLKEIAKTQNTTIPTISKTKTKALKKLKKYLNTQ